MDPHSMTPPTALAGQLINGGHRLLQRVYYEDTDFSGFVYHARYLHFMERGRTDFLRLLGVDQHAMAASQQARVFVVRRMEIDFRRPARMDDMLTIDTLTRAVEGARVSLAQKVQRGPTVLIEANVEVAVVDGEGRPRRLDQALTEALSKGRRSG